MKEARHTQEYTLQEYFIYIKITKLAKMKDTIVFTGYMFGRYNYPDKRQGSDARECPGVSGRGVGQRWPAEGLGALSVAVHKVNKCSSFKDPL